MKHAVPFNKIARLPLPNDNVAIATQRLEAGTRIQYEDIAFTLDYTIMVGHRFAIQTIGPDEGLYSWGLPFGIATEPISPGQYVCNEGMITSLSERSLDFKIPTEPNFRDRIVPYEINEKTFRSGLPTAPYTEERTFLGYQRSALRGVGTRNMVVVLGTTSSTASFARMLTSRFADKVGSLENIDGIVPIAHTEGSGYERLNNRDFLLRVLAGLIVHPNVGAILAVDLETDIVNNKVLETYLRDHNYPLDDVLYQFMTLSGNWTADLEQGAEILEKWLPAVNTVSRTPQPLAHLSIALQCGGSDAFSGISGNPLASSVAKEVIRYGGRANLAETDELIGAEAYVLQNVRSLDLARTFLDYIATFKERLSWHGQSAEGNPSGGNKYRGLYNIALKSIGAAMKRHPDVRLEHVVDYGERMSDPGYYFMNTPGNDLESIAGQVAGGSNLIIFVTGNGSITNFPFVPTIKVMTTTQRFELLSNEMDVNAGAYLDGTSMDDLTAETLDLLVEIASGQPSKGELAGHSQISIWRNWQQQDRSQLPLILERERPTGVPIPIQVDDAFVEPIPATKPHIGLILPTSLCSGQIARLAATNLNEQNLDTELPINRFATLVHTEGCGVAFASTREIYAETMVGYASHPLVTSCLFLEHGCEKAHNDYLHSLLDERGLSSDDFGWASVQLDGGIERVLDKIETYFRMAAPLPHKNKPITIALLTEGDVPPIIAASFADMTQQVVHMGGSVVMPHNSSLLTIDAFQAKLSLQSQPNASLAYGQSIQQAGFHLMETPTLHWAETVTGLGATGADVIVAYTHSPRAGHPFVPVVLVTDEAGQAHADLVLSSNADTWSAQIIAMLGDVVAGRMQVNTLTNDNVDFQLTRGWLGIST
ncbi:MAG: UxaA family hydrolase [Chloroflexota bacterium]